MVMVKCRTWIIDFLGFFLISLALHSVHCIVFALTKEKQPGSKDESRTEPHPESGAVEFKN